MNQLFHWLSKGANSLRSKRAKQGMTETVCTEVTVERNSATVVFGNVGPEGFKTCPLCGQSLNAGHQLALPPDAKKAERPFS